VTDDIKQLPVTAIHLDAVGGVAGDMFSAALLDIRPDLWSRCEDAIAAMGLPKTVRVTRESHDDGALTGSRFLVDGVSPEGNGHNHAPDSHVQWRDIRGRLERAPLDGEVREAALGIFGLLAGAEAAVRFMGKTPTRFLSTKSAPWIRSSISCRPRPSSRRWRPASGRSARCRAVAGRCGRRMASCRFPPRPRWSC
jgi:hypothetical protein